MAFFLIKFFSMKIPRRRGAIFIFVIVSIYVYWSYCNAGECICAMCCFIFFNFSFSFSTESNWISVGIFPGITVGEDVVLLCVNHIFRNKGNTWLFLQRYRAPIHINSPNSWTNDLHVNCYKYIILLFLIFISCDTVVEFLTSLIKIKL